MLRQLVREIESSGGALSLRDLSRRLDVEESALEGMLDHLVRKGLLIGGSGETAEACAGSCQACSSASDGCGNCPFRTAGPKKYLLRTRNPSEGVK